MIIVTHFPIKCLKNINYIKNLNIEVKMVEFVDSLNDLISGTNKSLRQLSKESSVSTMQYSRYLNGSIPTIDISLKIAEYFQCTLDYMFGLSDEKKSLKYTSYKYDISKFLTNYEKLLAQNNMSHYKFIKNSPFDESIIRHWKQGSIPRMDIIYYIAKNLNGSIDDLIGRY